MKKVKTLYLNFILINLIPLYVLSQETKKEEIKITPQEVLQVKNEQSNNVKNIAAPLFDPVTTDDPPKPNPFPTQSINEAALEATFGSQGINLEAEQLRHLKICFFYLEYITKLELAAKVAALARTKNIDVLSVLESDSWKNLVDSLGGWQKVVKELNTVPSITKNDWELVRGSIEISKWKDLIETSFWKTITVTTDLIIQSQFWQNYGKYSIIQAFDLDSSLLSSIYNIEARIFMYIPNIEVAYYNEDFNYLRNSSEYFRLTMVLTDAIRNRFINQIDEWKQYFDQKTNNLDLVKTYNAAEKFKDTTFYKIASLANQDFSQVVEQAATQNFPLKKLLGDQKPGPIAYEELICLAMIKNLQAQLQYLFDSKNLEKTMKIFANDKISKPIPSILLYEPDDHLYLEDLAMVVDRFNKATEQDELVTTQATFNNNTFNSSTTSIGNEKDERVVVQGLDDWIAKNWQKVQDKAKQAGGEISEEGKTTWKDIKKLGGDLSKLGGDALQGLKDEGTVAWQVANAFGALFSSNPEKIGPLMQNAAKLQEKVAKDISKANKDVQNVVNDTVAVAKDTSTIAATAIGDTIGVIDSRLGKDIEKGIESAAAIIIDVWAQIGATPFIAVGTVLELQAEAAATAAEIVTKSIMDIAKGNFSQLGPDVLNSVENMVADVATTLWSSISFIGKKIINEIKDAVAFVGAMVAYMTDFMVDTFAFATRTLGTLADAVGWGGAQEALNWLASETEAHRGTIAASITVVLLVGAVILTDGAALPLIAMTAGPQLFQVVGTLQQEFRSESSQKEAKAFVNAFQTFVNNNEIISTNAKNTWKNELTQKYQAQITNEERELGFYQNFLNRFFESTENQMSSYLGGNLAPQLTPDKKYNVRYADVGSLYGFETGDGKNTGVLNLNPSQGFPLYNKGRDLYSQEIAVYPALSMQLDENQQVTSETIYKFWFNQKETIPLAQETNEVEVRFQVIYALNMFNIGLYFGGDPIDVQNIIKEKKANINAAHLAKMLVYSKESKKDPAILKLYEHEGQGWFKQQPNGPAFEMGTWYHIKMQLNKTALQTKVWKENEPEPSWQSFTVQPTGQKTIGMISSGASIQYEVISPKIPVKAEPTLRKPITWKTETEREQYQRQTLTLLKNPVIGTFNLAPTDKIQILKGQYIYTTKATNLKDNNQQPINDFVVIGQQVGPNNVSNLGASPMKEINQGVLKDAPDVALASLITGDAYNSEGKRITTLANPLDTFLQKHGPLTDTLTKMLKAKSQTQQKAQLGPFKFGTIALNATSAADLNQGIYVYKATSPDKKLQKNGQPIKDQQGNLIYDYFITKDSSGSYFGAPYSESIPIIRSLVTGNEYGRQSNTPTDTGYPTGSQELGNVGITNVPPTLAKTIDNAANFYNAPVSKQSTGSSAVQKISGSDISEPTGPHSTTPTDIGKPTEIKPTEKSLQERSKQASGDETGGQLAGWGG